MVKRRCLTTGIFFFIADNQQQITNIADVNYRYEGAPSLDPNVSEKVKKADQYSYDPNGNLLCVNTGTVIADNKLRATNSRKLLWDEENRLLAVSDNGFVSNYWYDAAGERTVKESGDGEGVQVNGVLSAACTGTSSFTAYVSPYLVVSNGGNYTKHIYMGSQRIASKLASSDLFTVDPTDVTVKKAGDSDFSTKFATLTGTVKTRYDSLGVLYKGVPHTGGLITSPSGRTGGVSYFYHSDHLGSSSLITDISGNPVQHLEYVPFGEVFVEERNGNWSTPYKFNAKEQDEETGLYYYGARYYDPKRSVWLSVDQLAEKKPWMSSYVYCKDNPLRYIDPDGRNEWNITEEGKKVGKVIKTQKHDAFFMVDKNGNRMQNKDGSYVSVSFKHGTIESLKTQKYNQGKKQVSTFDSYKVRGDDNGTKLFKFFSENVTGKTNIEFSQAKTGVIGNRGLNFITTSHEVNAENGLGQLYAGQLYYRYTVREAIHSHQNFAYPSGLTERNQDIGNASDVTRVFKSQGLQAPVFKIYYVPTGAYIRYTPDSKREDFK